MITEQDIIALIGPPPRSRTKEYYKWRYRRMRLKNPEFYEKYLNNKRKKG